MLKFIVALLAVESAGPLGAPYADMRRSFL